MYPHITDEKVLGFIRASEHLHGMIPLDEQFLLSKLNAAYEEIEQLREENEKMKEQIEIIKTYEPFKTWIEDDFREDAIGNAPNFHLDCDTKED